MSTNKIRIHAFSDLIERYRAIFRHAWNERHQTDTPARLAFELAFLPANLELIETPPHPAPLWVSRSLLTIAVIVILIAAFGQIDVVAIAPGQLIPNANIKVIQPAITGVVRRISVQNGDRVLAGQLLVELDPTQTAADANRAKTTRIDAQLAIARAHALLLAQTNSTSPRVEPIPGAIVSRQTDNQNLAESAYREYLQKVAALKAELQKREAELATTRQEIDKLRQTAPIARQQASDYQELAKEKFVPSHEYLDKERLAIEQTQELAAQQSHARELAAGIAEQQRNIEAVTATFRREQLETLNKAEEDAAQHRDEETKADARQGLTQLRSPVSGIVEQLNVHTVGGVVTSAQALMEIVPDDTLEVDAHISNKDIGFVNPGQTAIVKITTFPYTRFGYITGTVRKVSNDAVTDKKRGLVFPARIHIPSSRFKVQDKWLNLSPGMEVTAEIKTGRQRVWQYFLSPLIEIGHESLRER